MQYECVGIVYSDHGSMQGCDTWWDQICTAVASGPDSCAPGMLVCTHLLPLAECVSPAQYPLHSDEQSYNRGT